MAFGFRCSQVGWDWKYMGYLEHEEREEDLDTGEKGLAS
jgi:hypothetical protein